tara:strand:- start:66 stop:332 length:267 start_codon:yes stop_codon:yes gene_type:complete
MESIKNAWNSMSSTVSNSVGNMVGTKKPEPSAMEELQQTGSTMQEPVVGGRKRKSKGNKPKRGKKSVKKSKSKKGSKPRKYKTRRHKK